jgi:(p)ppGpp synthase/HD superfamily hydrolase
MTLSKSFTSNQIVNNMLILATNAHILQTSRGGHPFIMHPIRVSAALRTTDVELQAMAIGHDLFNVETGVDASHLKHARMTDRVITGIQKMTKQRGMSNNDYIHMVCTSQDAMEITLRCLLDISDIHIAPANSEDKLSEVHQMYIHIKEKLRESVVAKTLLGRRTDGWVV